MAAAEEPAAAGVSQTESRNEHGGIQIHGARAPFTPSQWQELQNQALIFNHMTAWVPVPTELVTPIRKSVEAIGSDPSHQRLTHNPSAVPMSSFQMGFAKDSDPEPGRCRRTDGNKWRCSKDALPGTKYCKRHMHRGRKSYKKP